MLRLAAAELGRLRGHERQGQRGAVVRERRRPVERPLAPGETPQDGHFETALVDERGRRRYAPRFGKYNAPPLGPPEMWWPWGAHPRHRKPPAEGDPEAQSIGRDGGTARALMNRASLLKEQARKAPDPRAEVRAGVA